MDKKLFLENRIGRYDSGNLEITNGDLDILTNYEQKYGEEVACFIAKIGEETYKGNIVNKLITIPKSFLKPGTLELEIQVKVKGNIVRKFTCDKLILQELNGGFLTFPQFDELKGTVDEELAQIKQEVKLLHQLVFALIEDKDKEGE